MTLRSFYTFVCSLMALQVQAQLSGKILDENNQALPFASVYVRNSTNGTVANAEGEYRLALKPGSYEVVYQYLGYHLEIEKITIQDKAIIKNVRMKPNDLVLGEVTITDRDPAEQIMREVIAKRKYFRDKMPQFTCDAYIKGLYKFDDVPQKFMGKKLGDLGGVLDSNRQGIIYFSESVSQLYVRDQPRKVKEIMISSKVSGSENGFSMNRSTMTDLNLYDEYINIERDLLSPLASNAFSYYNFKLLGRFKDENGYDIAKIKVIPKRPADPVFAGVLYVVDSYWNLSGADLFLTGSAIKQPVLDTLYIKQEFVPLEKPDTWAMFAQNMHFKFGILGFKIKGYYACIFSNYNTNPNFDSNFFNKETFKIEKIAKERDSLYWVNTRPVPLTIEENRDYIKKDSLSKIWNSDAFIDSMDREENKFGLSNLLFGYEWQNSHKRVSVSYPAAMNWIQFNSVQGWLLNIEPEWEKKSKDKDKYWQLGGNINYGFAETKLRGGLSLKRRFESIYYNTLELQAGSRVAQVNSNEPISVVLNGLYSLYGKRNYMVLYDQQFARASWSRVIKPGWVIQAISQWSDRRPLVNHTDFSFRKKDWNYLANSPLRNGAEPFFTRHQAFTVEAILTIRPGETYSSYPSYREYQSSDWPEISLLYRKAVPGIAGSDVDYDYIQARISKNDLNFGLAGYTEFNIIGGLFLRDNKMEFIDYHHVNGNQTFFGKSGGYLRSFNLLPYYDFSTRRPFIQAHAQHHLKGWLLDKIPGLRKLNWNEVFGVSVYYTDRTVTESSERSVKPYTELNFGFENIGIKAIRPLRIDLFSGFYGQKFARTGIILGISM